MGAFQGVLHPKRALKSHAAERKASGMALHACLVGPLGDGYGANGM